MRRPSLALVTVPLLAGAAALGACAHAGRVGANPPDSGGVVETVQALFDAMREGDADALERVLAPEVMLAVVNAEGGDSVSLATRADLIERFTRAEATLDERMWRPQVRIDGDLATLWAPYSFRIDGELSHCGHDAVHLVRRDGRWRIVSIAYTRTTEGCERFEPPSVAARHAS